MGQAVVCAELDVNRAAHLSQFVNNGGSTQAVTTWTVVVETGSECRHFKSHKQTSQTHGQGHTAQEFDFNIFKVCFYIRTLTLYRTPLILQMTVVL